MWTSVNYFVIGLFCSWRVYVREKRGAVTGWSVLYELNKVLFFVNLSTRQSFCNNFFFISLLQTNISQSVFPIIFWSFLMPSRLLDTAQCAFSCQSLLDIRWNSFFFFSTYGTPEPLKLLPFNWIRCSWYICRNPLRHYLLFYTNNAPVSVLFIVLGNFVLQTRYLCSTLF